MSTTTSCILYQCPPFTLRHKRTSSNSRGGRKKRKKRRKGGRGYEDGLGQTLPGSTLLYSPRLVRILQLGSVQQPDSTTWNCSWLFLAAQNASSLFHT
ncbi:hypothetical protein CGRA01v4_13136 [Colletotrichum graminicola]|nr:hypothetical protein CGRA01v4_13136 [Colletotrichum graminicola]